MGKLTAVILVGGPGTRLRPLTDDRPKSLVPVLNRPVMEHTIAYLKRFGVEDIVLTLSYLPDAIRERLGDGSRYGVRPLRPSAISRRRSRLTEEDGWVLTAEGVRLS